MSAVPKPKRRSPKSPTPIARTAVKRVNAKRRKSEFARAYESRERVKWVQQQRCVVCGVKPSENAHVENGGAGRKANADKIAPLCRFHHRVYHSIGAANLEAWCASDGLPVNLKAAAAETENAWQSHLAAGRTTE